MTEGVLMVYDPATDSMRPPTPQDVEINEKFHGLLKRAVRNVVKIRPNLTMQERIDRLERVLQIFED